MTKRLRMLMLAALIAGGAVACDDNPTGLGDKVEPSNELDVNADMELQVVGDADLVEVTIEDISLSMSMSADGPPFVQGRECFQEARRLLLNGDEDAARDRARECRLLLVQAMLERHGEAAIDELFGRVENLVERIGEASDEFARLDDLETRLQGLLDEAYALRDAGDLAGAGERLVLALQIADRMRYRHPDFDADPAVVARFAVVRGGEAIRLAGELITDTTRRQEILLFRAGELQRRALFSFEHGWYRRTVAQAQRAEELALFAVLNGERPTVEDAQRLLSLAEEMIVVAEDAIGENPSDVQLRLLNHAIRLKDRGAEAINTWHWRGVGLLWRSAVTSAVLIPNESPADSA